jgi:hypothetical protein
VLTVIGPSYIEIPAATVLTVLSAVVLSSCASATTRVVYQWRLFIDGSEVVKISTSLDPRRYTLPPYSLSVGLTYTLTITATSGTSSSSSAPVTIFVLQGLVSAAVIGGYIRSTPIDLDFNLDASISRDADVDPSFTAVSTLAYQWTCTIGSIINFGIECGLFGTPLGSVTLLQQQL